MEEAYPQPQTVQNQTQNVPTVIPSGEVGTSSVPVITVHSPLRTPLLILLVVLTTCALLALIYINGKSIYDNGL